MVNIKMMEKQKIEVGPFSCDVKFDIGEADVKCSSKGAYIYPCMLSDTGDVISDLSGSFGDLRIEGAEEGQMGLFCQLRSFQISSSPAKGLIEIQANVENALSVLGMDFS